MAQDGPLPIEQLKNLPRQLEECFSLEELRDLAFKLRLDYENIPGDTKATFARELVLALNRELRLPALLTALRQARPDVDWELDDVERPAEPPYRGLDFYREDDVGLFFGRDLLTADLIARLRAHPFLVVVGASGSGKSSIVRAGVVPALKRGERLSDGRLPPKGSSDWAYLTITPTERPLERLACTLTSDLPNKATEDLIEDLLADAEHLRPVVSKYLERVNAPRLFLLVDQFEEVFTACKDEAERRSFIDGLLAAAGGPATIILTLRADFYHRCEPYTALREALEQHQRYIGVPGREEMRAAIVEPAVRRGYALEEGLVELMLRDAGYKLEDKPDKVKEESNKLMPRDAAEEQGALPLLSHALLETWRRREGRTMTLDGYNRAGGVRGAIAHTAEEAFADLDESSQKTMERILVDLTELGEGVEDTRRRVSRAELDSHPWFRPDGEKVLEKLVSARLATADGDAVQIAHEALIREWPRLRGWLAVDREGERLRRDLAEAARDWRNSGQDESYLIGGARLATAREWADANADRLDEWSAAFLAASTERVEREVQEAEAARQRELDSANALAAAETRRARITRRFLYVVGALALLAVAAAIFAMDRSGEAQQQAATATVALGIADQARGTAESEATRADQSLATALAAQSTAEAEKGRADQNAASESFARATAEAALEDAKVQAAIANSRAIAAQSSLIAETNATASLLLAIEANNTYETQESLTALHFAYSLPGIELAQFRHGGTGEESGIVVARWNHDQSRIMTAGNDHTVRIWDVATGETLLTLQHPNGLLGAQWNKDESLILTNTFGGSAYIWDTETGEMLREMRHANGVYSAQWNSDESRILTSDFNFAARVWDAASGKEILTLSHGEYSPTFATWNTDETRILTKAQHVNDHTGRIFVWDATTGEKLLEIPSQFGIWSVEWDSSEQRILSANVDQTAKVWDANTGEEILSMEHDDRVVSALWSNDEERILTAGFDFSARVWDATTGQRLLELLHGGVVNSATWNRDESLIVTSSTSQVDVDGNVSIWNADDGRHLFDLPHNGAVGQSEWNSIETRILTSSKDGAARIWDATRASTFVNHSGLVLSATWSRDGSRLLTTGEDGTARVWDTLTGEQLLVVTHEERVDQASWSPDESKILTVSQDDTARVWDATSSRELLVLHHDRQVNWGQWTNDGTRILTAGGDDTVRVWDASTGDELMKLPAENINWKAIWNSDETRILTSGDGTSRVWDAESGEKLLAMEHDNWVYASIWSRDEGRILTFSADGSARVWDAHTGEQLLLLQPAHETQVAMTSAVWNADETRILTSSTDGTARIWDALTGSELLVLTHTTPLFEAIWDSESKYVITAGNDGEVRVWDATTGDELYSLIDSEALIYDVKLSPDGNRVAIVGGDGLVAIQFLSTTDTVQAACQHLGRNLTWIEWQTYFSGTPYSRTCENLPVHYTVPESE